MRFIVFASLLATSFAALRGYAPPTPNGSNGSGHSKNGLANGHFGSANGHRGASHDGGQFNGQGHQTNGFGSHSQSFDGTAHIVSEQGSFGVPLPAENGFNGGSPAVDVRQEIPNVGLDQHVFGDVQQQVSNGFGSQSEDISCNEGEVLNSEGLCAEAEVSKAIFLYTAPQRISKQRSEPAPTPKPKLNYNIVFVKAPEDSEEDKPVVIPPPQQKTIVYVLSKDGEGEEQEIIEVPAGPAHKPEVYYIRYNEGENPDLSLGLNLETALASAVNQEGKIIEVEVSDDSSSGQFSFKGDSGFDGQTDLHAGGSAGLNGQSDFHASGANGFNGQSETHAAGANGLNGQSGHAGGSAGFNGQSGLETGGAAGYETDSGSQSGNGFRVQSNGASGHGNGFGAHQNGASGHGNGFGAHKNGASGHGNGFGVQTNGASGHVNGFQAQSGSAGFGNGASFHSGAPFEVKTSSESDSGEISLDAGSHLLVQDQQSQSFLPQQPSHQRQQPSGLYNTPRRF